MFFWGAFTEIETPASVTEIERYAFSNCTQLTKIVFKGTMLQWNAISKGEDWASDVPSTCVVQCTDGSLKVKI